MRHRPKGRRPGPKSSIEKLPAGVRDELHALLRDPTVTQTDATARVNEMLEELGLPQRINRRAMSRYDQKINAGAGVEAGRDPESLRDVAEAVDKLSLAVQGLRESVLEITEIPR